jgi:hypothetical protein
VDGDHASEDCLVLPGDAAPERVVYQELRDANWPNLADRFGIGAGTLHTALEDAMLDPDHHRWNTRVGDVVRKSSASVWEILANEWARSCLLPEHREELVEGLVAAMEDR